MRSIKYILGGIPKTKDDYDHLLKNKPSSVSLELREGMASRGGEVTFPVWHYVADLTLRYNKNKEAHRSFICGGYVTVLSDTAEIPVIDEANGKLEELIETIKTRGIPVEGEQQRFVYPVSIDKLSTK